LAQPGTLRQDRVIAYWLMKSEPDELSIDHLARSKRKPFRWDGVHNYRARNWMLAMAPGDQFFFAHSSCKIPGIGGIAEIVGGAYVDPTRKVTTSIRRRRATSRAGSAAMFALWNGFARCWR
jgi:predicted RNA-binding protein with PUA-like domain